MIIVAFSVLQLYRAGRAGVAGKAALVRAEQLFEARQLEPARQQLEAAEDAFRRMGSSFDRLGPLLPLARITPFVRIQVRGVEHLADAGMAVSVAGRDLAVAADAIAHPSDGDVPLAGALDALGEIRDALGPAVDKLQEAVDGVAALDGYRLVGPLDDARRELAERLPDVTARATSAGEGVSALTTILGGDGPRRYLLMSQNPAEVRPTGGYIGTYGILATDGRRLELERYEPTENWTFVRPEIRVPPEEAGSPFRFYEDFERPLYQSLANVNNVPDWPRAAQLAMRLWERGGEVPVDGVFSITPAFLKEILAVVGPVEVAEYGEIVTAENVIERFDYHTELVEAGEQSNVERKAFVAALAELVVGRLLDAPASQWQGLAEAVGSSLDAREAMAWVADPDVGGTLARLGWDGALPEVGGDFFYDAEFEYAAKNGRDLRRTFDHHVALRPDGTARITTTLTIRNEGNPGKFNVSSLAYISVYGPSGAVVDEEASHPLIPEPAIAGHPAAGWFRQAPPGEETSVTVVWEAPDIAREDEDGRRIYSLLWMRLPDHTGDVLNLRVDLPDGWEWDGAAPPERVELDQDVVGSWSLSP